MKMVPRVNTTAISDSPIKSLPESTYFNKNVQMNLPIKNEINAKNW